MCDIYALQWMANFADSYLTSFFVGTAGAYGVATLLRLIQGL